MFLHVNVFVFISVQDIQGDRDKVDSEVQEVQKVRDKVGFVRLATDFHCLPDEWDPEFVVCLRPLVFWV